MNFRRRVIVLDSTSDAHARSAYIRLRISAHTGIQNRFCCSFLRQALKENCKFIPCEDIKSYVDSIGATGGCSTASDCISPRETVRPHSDTFQLYLTNLCSDVRRQQRSTADAQLCVDCCAQMRELWRQRCCRKKLRSHLSN